MLKSQIHLSQYDRCQTQRPKKFKELMQAVSNLPIKAWLTALRFSRRSNPPEELPLTPRIVSLGSLCVNENIEWSACDGRRNI